MVVNKYSWRCWVNFYIIFTIFSSPVLGCCWHEETLVAPVLPAGLAEGPGLGEAGQHHEEEDHGEGVTLWLLLIKCYHSLTSPEWNKLLDKLWLCARWCHPVTKSGMQSLWLSSLQQNLDSILFFSNQNQIFNSQDYLTSRAVSLNHRHPD